MPSASVHRKKVERRYHVNEQKCLALGWAVKCYCPILENRRFAIRIDNKMYSLWSHDKRLGALLSFAEIQKAAPWIKPYGTRITWSSRSPNGWRSSQSGFPRLRPSFAYWKNRYSTVRDTRILFWLLMADNSSADIGSAPCSIGV